MELRQLKYFVKAAELQNFTEASNELYITQSTLSQQIKQLEDELGIPLFDRIAKRVKLTEAGTTFLPFALKTLQDAEDGKVMLKDLMNLKTGSLTIGVTYGLTHLLSNAILAFSNKYPDIKINVSFGTTKELMLKLDEGKLDFVLSFSQENASGTHTIEKLFTSSLVLIVHSNHTLSTKKQIPFKELEKHFLILPSQGYSIRNFLDTIVDEHQISLKVSMEINDINMLLMLVDKGNWATILMATSIFNHPKLHTIKITGANFERCATAIWKASSYQKKAAKYLLQLLKDNNDIL